MQAQPDEHIPWQRRSTIEVHPIFSEAPHLRSSIPRPKTDFQQKSKCLVANNPMAQVYKTFFFFGIKIGTKKPRLSETK